MRVCGPDDNLLNFWNRRAGHARGRRVRAERRPTCDWLRPRCSYFIVAFEFYESGGGLSAQRTRSTDFGGRTDFVVASAPWCESYLSLRQKGKPPRLDSTFNQAIVLEASSQGYQNTDWKYPNHWRRTLLKACYTEIPSRERDPMNVVFVKSICLKNKLSQYQIKNYLIVNDYPSASCKLQLYYYAVRYLY